MKFQVNSRIRIVTLIMMLSGTVLMALPLVRLGGIDSGGNLVGIEHSDHLMHLAYIQEIKNHFPPQQPLFAGEKLYNYHWGSDALTAIISNLTGFEARVLYYKILPVVYAFLYGLISWWMAKSLGLDLIERWFFLFFQYFGASFSFAADWIITGNLSWDDAFGINQPVMLLGNVPLMTSLIMVMAVIGITLRRKPNKSRIHLGWLLILLAVLPLFKVYGGIAAFVVVTAGAGWYLVVRREWGKKLTLVAAGAMLLAGLIMIPGTHDTGGLVWLPLHPLTRLIESPNFAELTGDLLLRIQHYKMTQNIFRMTLIYSLAGLVYLVGNLGSRIVGLIVIGREVIVKRVMPVEAWILLIAAVTITVIPMFFIQKTGGFNITQLFLYLMMMVNLVAAVGWARLARSGSVELFLGVVMGLLLITIPGTVGVIQSELRSEPKMLESEMVTDLQDLGKLLSSDSVMVLAPELIMEQENYVAALTERRVYLEGVEYPRIQGHDVESRQKKLEKAFGDLYLGGEINNFRETLGVGQLGAIIVGSDNPLPGKNETFLWRKNEQLIIYIIGQS